MATENIIDDKKIETPAGEADKATPKVDDNKQGENQGEENKELTQEQKDQIEADKKAKEERINKRKDRLNNRFRQLTGHVKAKEAEVESWREMVKEVTGEEPPKREDFETPEEYQDAVKEYRDKIRHPKQMLEKAEKDASKAEADYNQALVDSWNEKIEAVAEELPDYQKVVKASKTPLSEPMMKAILRSDLGPQIVYHLAQNPDVAEEILELSPTEQVLEIGRLESKVQSERKVDSEETETHNKKKEKEPNPPPGGAKPKGDTAHTKKAPGEMSLEEYSKWRENGGGKGS